MSGTAQRERRPGAILPVRRAESAEDLRRAAHLFADYQRALGVDLCFQGFAKELDDPASVYEAVFLAGDAERPAGCIALKRLGSERCEMKRLYVAPEARGSGAGRALVERLIDEAKARSYREMVLDTLERLAPAIALYETLGFVRTGAYTENPEPDVVYMRLAL